MNTTDPYVADILYMEMYNEVEIFYFKTFYLTIWLRPTLKDMMRVLYEASNPLTSGNIVAETKFASQEGKLFPNKFRNIFFCRNSVSYSLLTSLQMFPTRETLFS